MLKVLPGWSTPTSPAPATNPGIWLAWQMFSGRGTEHELIARQYVRQQGSTRRGKRRAGQHGAEQQRAQRGEWHARHRHQPDGPDPEQVAGDHDTAAREQVREAGEQRALTVTDARALGQRIELNHRRLDQ
jgi:hypothetical protein